MKRSLKAIDNQYGVQCEISPCFTSNCHATVKTKVISIGRTRTANLRHHQHLFKYFSTIYCCKIKEKFRTGSGAARSPPGQQTCKMFALQITSPLVFIAWSLITWWVIPIKLCLGMWDIERQLQSSSTFQSEERRQWLLLLWLFRFHPWRFVQLHLSDGGD